MDYVYAVQFKNEGDVSCVYRYIKNAEDTCKLLNIAHWNEMQTPEEYRFEKYAPYFVVSIPLYD